jgi:DNA replication ATP-dependent helicase Dna2
MSELYHARLQVLATDAAATPADQLPRLRKLLETVLRDEHKHGPCRSAT